VGPKKPKAMEAMAKKWQQFDVPKHGDVFEIKTSPKRIEQYRKKPIKIGI